MRKLSERDGPQRFVIMRAQGIIMAQRHCTASAAMKDLTERAHGKEVSLAAAAATVIHDRSASRGRVAGAIRNRR